MPSSLTRVISITLVFSTCPPVSVLVRARTVLPRGFSRRYGVRDSPAFRPAGIAPRRNARSDLPERTSYTLTPGQPSPGLIYPAASPHRLRRSSGSVRPEGQPLSNSRSALARARRYWNINQLCIDYASRPRLSSRLTLGGLAFPRNPWAFGGGVSHPSLATHACILTRPRSTTVHTAASLRGRRSPTTPVTRG